jgi:hypothetical protein
MNAAVYSDNIFSDKETKVFKGTDKIISVRLKNNGNTTILQGWGSISDRIEPGESKTISAGENRYIEGELKFDFDTSSGTIKSLYMETCREGSNVC